MSLNSLPPEIFRLIVEATIPNSYHSTTYEKRQRRLCRLCLVSRDFRSIAEPLLFETVVIKSEKSLERLLESLTAEEHRDFNVKMLALQSWDPYQKWLHAGTLEQVNNSFPALSTLSIHVYGPRNLRLDSLVHLKNLSDLHVYGIDFQLSAPLLSLRSLTLSGFRSSGTFCLDPKSIIPPSLRYLALIDTGGAFENDALSEESMLIRLLPQLDTWSFDIEGLVDVCSLGGSSILKPFLSRALIDGIPHPPCSKEDLSNALDMVQYLRPLYTFDDAQEEYPISNLVATLQSPRPPRLLHSIFLNRSPGGRYRVNRAYRRAAAELYKVCEEKGIEVVLEEQPFRVGTDPAVSGEFWRRMKEKR